jgi:DNA-binding response OmpR family regulator
MTAKTTSAKRVLIADDDPAISISLATYLHGLGYEALTAADGEEAMRAIESHRPDLAILDIDMPKASGIVVTVQLRAHPDKRLRRTPVLILTAKSDTRHEAYSAGAGANAFVSKPVAPADLAKTIRKLIG